MKISITETKVAVSNGNSNFTKVSPCSNLGCDISFEDDNDVKNNAYVGR
jgi:hypothetical protein